MKYIDFKTKFENHRIIDIRNVITLFGKIDKRRLYEWQQHNHIKRLSNNFYIFSNIFLNDSILKQIANKIYSPSYIALESALSYYNLIPEAVFQVKSITTKKTKKIQNDIANFSYQTIKNSLFFGYSLKEESHNTFFISDPEKTILDFLYFNPHLTSENDFEALRLNQDVFQEIICLTRLHNYLDLFNHQRLAKSLKTFLRGFHVEF